ncbi:thiamine phosphate synthase [Maridesulfovibrio hydrothermalis]|uniref:Thiamine-phosphate synthase n=1 Tax=Maridesulfovibrio hydrothermalis AM13 = DSM 14728 TaxID=1121451 RepID=L0RBJ4_9BACT|nr:thiamine phosphate synthase [Maridesulfovibrio hydrothermalis]CCO24134.1 Thiamine-phosphate synthase [Maridesulfovibrio hydrothermalis AM13 = DSM 14728]
MNAKEITRKNILDTDIYCLTALKFSNGRSNLEVVREMLDNDIKLIQYREKEIKSGQKYEECLEIRKMTREAGAVFIINDDIDLAMMVEADGIHIGQEDFPVHAVRKLIGEKMAIGLSTHSPEEAQNALKSGADYIGVGPIFRTFTKDDVVDPVGFEYLDYVVKNINLPFVAIGGIKEHNIAEVMNRGAKCVALVTEIVGADDIGAKIRELRTAMNK